MFGYVCLFSHENQDRLFIWFVKAYKKIDYEDLSLLIKNSPPKQHSAPLNMTIYAPWIHPESVGIDVNKNFQDPITEKLLLK